ncbi:hypothetical protein ACLGL1_03030 [Peptococcus simiae]|uniref:hypothetical protein n=1 Tax=Peptococcus simiae TaxID=1643805 RepID=UPI00397F144F
MKNFSPVIAVLMVLAVILTIAGTLSATSQEDPILIFEAKGQVDRVEPLNRSADQAIRAEGRDLARRLTAYEAGNQVIHALLEGVAYPQALEATSHPSPQLPAANRIKAAQHLGCLPTEQSMAAYLQTQQALYEEDEDIRTLTDDLCRAAGIDLKTYWETVAYNQAFAVLLSENVEKAKSA